MAPSYVSLSYNDAMKRTAAILLFALRYSPLPIALLLLVGWYFSQYQLFGWAWLTGERWHGVFFRSGSIRYVGAEQLGEQTGFHSQPWQLNRRELLGEFEFEIFAWTK